MKSYRTMTDQWYPMYVFYCPSIFHKVTMVKEDKKKTKRGEEKNLSTQLLPDQTKPNSCSIFAVRVHSASPLLYLPTSHNFMHTKVSSPLLPCICELWMCFYTCNFFFFLNDVPSDRSSTLCPGLPAQPYHSCCLCNSSMACEKLKKYKTPHRNVDAFTCLGPWHAPSTM